MTNNERGHYLREAARRARGRSYSPYSHFPVGAAIETTDGKVFEGCNVEIASYSLTICAERVALFQAVAAGARTIKAVAVSCEQGADDDPGRRMPCGACRQALAEFADGDLEVFVDGVGRFLLSELLPDPFRL